MKGPPISVPQRIPSSEVKLFSARANPEIFHIKFYGSGWPAQLPKNPNLAAPKSFSVSSIKVLRHGSPLYGTTRGPHFLKKDTGGWIPTDLLPDYFENAYPEHQEPIREYRHTYGHLLDSPLDAKIGAYVACWAANKGNRLSFMMAVRTTIVNDRVVRDYIRPVAVRCCGGQSLEDQPFLRMGRFNWKLTPELKLAVPGLFHVTTTEAWPQILQDGLKPGIDLPSIGRN